MRLQRGVVRSSVQELGPKHVHHGVWDTRSYQPGSSFERREWTGPIWISRYSGIVKGS